MRKLMFLGLLMVLGFSFAQPEFPTSGPEWGVLKQTICQGFPAWFQAMAVYEVPYYVWDGECYVPEMPYSPGYICEEICDSEGVLDYYIQWAITCSEREFGPTSPECQARSREFYYNAKLARGIFSTNKNAHILFARQALAASRYHSCETSPEDVMEVMMISGTMVRECLGADSEEFLGYMEEFCSFCVEPS